MRTLSTTFRPFTGQRSDEQDTGERSTSESPRWPWRLGAAVLVMACVTVLLVVAPAIGALVSLALFVAFVPTVSGLSGRIVTMLCLLCGLVAASVVLGSLTGVRLDLTVSTCLAALPGLAAAAMLVTRDARALVPRADHELVALAGTALVAWLLTGATLLGRPQPGVMGGLSALGWDHQSHFAIFVNVYTLEGVWQQDSGVPRPSFDAYPPLAGVMASMATRLADGGTVPTDLLVTRYAQGAAVLAALALAVLAWLAAAAAAAVVRPRDGRFVAVLPALAGLAVGGFLCFGPLLSFFDYGFSNFLVAAALASAVSWLALVPLEAAPVRAGLVLASGVAATSLLWTPLVLLLVPAGLVLAWRVVRGRRWLTLAGLGVLLVAAAGVSLWQARRLVPDDAAAASLSQTVGAVSGGMPAVPLGQALTYLVAGLLFLLVAARGRRLAWLAAVAPAVGALALLGGFVVVSLRTTTGPQHAYYVAKAGWALYIVAIPVLGAFLGLLFGSVAARDAGADAAGRRAGAARLAVVVLGATALLWSSLGYVNTPGSKSGFIAVPPVYDSAVSRWHVFRGVDAGNLVFSASRSIGRSPGRIPIIWDGGDLKQNRWLASLREQLDTRADAVYNPLPGGPYLQPAADALRRSLEADPSLKVTVAYFLPESAELLEPLAEDFPGRVRLVTMQ